MSYKFRENYEQPWVFFQQPVSLPNHVCAQGVGFPRQERVVPA